MKKEYWSPVLNMIAMLLLIGSRLISDSGYDWLAIAATVIFLLSAGQLFNFIRKFK
jgi:hypothetical protein